MAVVAPIAASERVALVDVLRGFALLGILVVNTGVFKSAGFGPAADAPPLDQLASGAILLLFTLKFYVLFSFLFGYGFSVQMARAAERGAPWVPRYLRRLLGLLLLGVAHAVLLYVGDILVTYAVLGVALLAFRRARSRVLVGVAIGLVALSALGVAGVGAVVSVLPASDTADVAREVEVDAARTEAAYRGSPGEVVEERLRTWPAVLVFALLGQGPTVLGMFLLGLWAGRRRLLERIDEHRPLLRRALVLGLVVGLPGSAAFAAATVASGFDFDATFFLASAVDFATAPFLTAGYVSGIALLHARPAGARRLAVLAPVGRMALSNYLLQSLVCSLVFTGYGLGLFGRVGAAAGLVVSFAIFAAQVPLSAWWLRRFRFGPAEWLLRSFTYARRQPLRSDPAA